MPKGQVAWNKDKKCPQFSGENNPRWKGGKIKKMCIGCNKEFYVYSCKIKIGKGKYCSKKCYFKNRILWHKGTKGVMKANKTSFKKGHIQPKGKASPTWKGGKNIIGGYITIYKPSHPFSNHNKKYVFEHRLAIEKHIGKYLKPIEAVHHINENTADNRIENLMLFKNRRYHQWFHRKGSCDPIGIIFDGRHL